MPEQVERASRKPYTTASSKREALIEKIQDRYNRTPTANELLAVENIPCGPRSQLFDRSGPGVYIYQRLRYAEEHTDVSVLEEAGRILRLQMVDAWTPTSSMDGDQSSSSPDLFEQAHRSNQPPRQQLSPAWTPTTSMASNQSFLPDTAQEHRSDHAPRQDQAQAQAEASTRPTIPNTSYGSEDIPFPLRLKPTISSSSPPAPASPPARGVTITTNPLLPAAAAAVTARVIHGDVYYMPISLRFDGLASNSSVAVHVPGRATAAYAEPLVEVTMTVDAREGAKDV